MVENIHILLLLILLKLSAVRAQTGGTLDTGDTYVCVPAGFCDNSNPSVPNIDPRIVTPVSDPPPCPSGTVPCVTQGPNSQCGVQFIPQTVTADGTAEFGVYPWQAYLRNSTSIYAGSGVLLDNFHVLTAAHKVADSLDIPGTVRVFMGIYNPNDLTQTQNSVVASIVIHPDYDPSTLINDLAILTMATPFSLSQDNINTACLPDATADFTGQRCVVAGWGQTSFAVNDAPVTPLKQVYVSVTDYSTCRASYASSALLGSFVDMYLDPSGGEICAGGESMKDACTQDGGSPLICQGDDGKFIIAGLVAWGKNCGQAGVYGVYVNVPFYRDWIDLTIAELNGQAVILENRRKS